MTDKKADNGNNSNHTKKRFNRFYETEEEAKYWRKKMLESIPTVDELRQAGYKAKPIWTLWEDDEDEELADEATLSAGDLAERENAEDNSY